MGKITKGARPFGWLADIAGKKIANSIGQIWSAAMMLEHLGHPNAAEAIETILAAGPRTRDIGGNASTAQVGQAIAKCDLTI